MLSSFHKIEFIWIKSNLFVVSSCHKFNFPEVLVHIILNLVSVLITSDNICAIPHIKSNLWAYKIKCLVTGFVIFDIIWIFAHVMTFPIKSLTGPWLLLNSSIALHCSAGCHPAYYYYKCTTRCGVRVRVVPKNLPGLVPRDPGSPLTQKLSHPSPLWQVRGEVEHPTPGQRVGGPGHHRGAPPPAPPETLPPPIFTPKLGVMTSCGWDIGVPRYQPQRGVILCTKVNPHSLICVSRKCVECTPATPSHLFIHQTQWYAVCLH